jgi:threonine aldolase
LRPLRYGVRLDLQVLRRPLRGDPAGRKDLISEAKELRHTFGGLIYHGWMAALPALAACDGFEARFTQAHSAGVRLLDWLHAAGGFTVQRVENGSNISFVQVSPARAEGLSERLTKADIHILPIHTMGS